MSRRIFGFVFAAAILAFVQLAEAQQLARIPTIAILEPGSASAPGLGGVDAFRQRLRELGYIEGQTVRFQYRYADYKLDRLSSLAAELVQLKPDVIFTHADSGALAAKRATTTIPIVVGVAPDLVGDGIVASLARPGGNVTGMTLLHPELDQKRLEMLKETAPKTTRVAFLAVSTSSRYLQPLESAARAVKVQLQVAEVHDPGDIESAFAMIIKGGVNAVLVQDIPPLARYPDQVASLAVKHRLPSISQSPRFAEAGGLLQYGADVLEMFRRSATLVDKILKGAKPADLPVEQPMKFEFVINLKAAKQIGLTIPPNVLARADKVIK
jgi:ABC-type uncharacterized transport system substrate-binding protein